MSEDCCLNCKPICARCAKPPIVLHLPYPPSMNHYWRRATRNGRPGMVRSPEAQAYRLQVWAAVYQQGRPSVGTARCSLEIQLYPPDRRRRDLDNALKGLLDSLEHAGVYANDGQIDRLIVTRGEAGDGRVVVTIQPMGVAA